MYNIEDKIFELFDENFIDINYNNGVFSFSTDIDFEDAVNILKEKSIDFTSDQNSLTISINTEKLNETYTDDELDKLEKKTFNQQKILNIYRRTKYGDSRLFAHTRCTNCGREKKLFLSNLINDPEKYGSCICSDTNIESKLDTINGLYKGSKKLSSNTSGYTGVYFVSKYKGEAYNKWRAYIEIDGKRTYLGDFKSKGRAIKARKKAAQKGIKWYQEHKNDFMKTTRKRNKRYRKNHKTN